MVRLILAFLLLGSCADRSPTPENAIQRVQRTGVLRAGIIVLDKRGPRRSEIAFLNELAFETHAEPVIVTVSPDALLPHVEDGSLDIVLGRFPPGSRWAERVKLLPARPQAPAEAGAAPFAAVRNGEVVWTSVIYRHAGTLLREDL